MLGCSKSVEATFELRNFLDETGGLPETLRSFFWKSSILDSEKKMLWYSTPILETAQMATVNDSHILAVRRAGPISSCMGQTPLFLKFSLAGTDAKGLKFAIVLEGKNFYGHVPLP